MSNSSKPSLLDALRAKAESVREHEAAARQPVERAREEINSCLWRAFRFLDEVMGHLEVIRPKVLRKFRLEHLLTLENPQFDGGFASFRRRGLSMQDELDHVQVFYRLAGVEPILLRVHPSAVMNVDERLRGSSLPFRYETQQDEKGIIRFGLFHVEPKISGSVLFQPDYDRQVVEVSLSNVDRFETVRLEFRPAAIDVAALEDLVGLMLGESNGFLHRAPLALIRKKQDEAPRVSPAGSGLTGSRTP